MTGEPGRPFGELRDSGLLWLINRVVFHPRGFALALTIAEGEPTGWKLLGDGSEVWRFDGDEDGLFERASKTLNDQSPAGGTAATDSAIVVRGDLDITTVIAGLDHLAYDCRRDESTRKAAQDVLARIGAVMRSDGVFRLRGPELDP